MTEYKYRANIAVPEHLLTEANHLACIAGESVDDINTFKELKYQDKDGRKYAYSSAAVKKVFLDIQSKGLGEIPAHAIGVADKGLAQIAFDSLNKVNGLRMIVNDSPQSALLEMGLTLIEEEDTDQ